MRAEVVSVGTELLLGEIVDTNSAWLSARLADAGYDVFWSGRVGDNLDRVVAALEQALRRSQVVITTGGLGSTDDDLTRTAVARVVGETPFVDETLEAGLRAWCARSSVPFQDIMRQQALRIASAESLPNRVGTAPGWLVRLPDDRFVVTLPGPPREMGAMWEEQALPRLPRLPWHLLRHTFKTCGIGEGKVFEMLGDWVKPSNPSVATYAKRDGVHVRVGARAEGGDAAVRLAAPVLEAVRAILGASVWGENDDELAGRIVEVLRAQGARLATIESLTGGQVAQEITAVSGVSDVYLGGAVAYDPFVKMRLGVDRDIIVRHGVVSEETARAMAEACAGWFGCAYALATTGVAGPSELEGKPPGTVFVAVRGPRGTVVRELRYAARSRAQVQERATFAALTLLWRVATTGSGG